MKLGIGRIRKSCNKKEIFKIYKERFWSKVDKNGPLIIDTKCWIYKGACGDRNRGRGGYGEFHTRKLNWKRVREIRNNKNNLTVDEWAMKYNVHKYTIIRVQRNKRWVE